MRALLAAALLACVAGCAMRVKGRVSDADTGAPIGGAQIASDCYPRAVLTDPGGHYDLKTKWSSCVLTVDAPGYKTRVVTVNVEDERYRTQDVQLWKRGRLPPPLPPSGTRKRR